MATWPMLASGLRLVPGDLMDGRLVHAFLEHGYRWSVGDPQHASLWDAPFFHPMPNALAYSDAMVAAVPWYAPFRLLGLPADASFQLWVLAILASTFVAAYALARRPCELPPYPAAVAAFVITFCAPRLEQMGHPQLYTQVLSLSALAFGGTALRAFADDRPVDWQVQAGLAAALVLLALQFYAAVYLGWFTVLGLGVLLLVALLVPATRIPSWRMARDGAPGLMLGGLVAIALLWPLAMHYRAAALDIGPRPWAEVACYLPSPATWLTPSPASWWYGQWTALAVPVDDPCRAEKFLSFGYVTLVAGFTGLLAARRRPWVVVGLLTVLALVTLATMVGGTSPWAFVYRLVPGAIAIRAVGRLVLVLVIPVGLGVGLLLVHLQARGRRVLAVALGVICAAEQGVTTRHYPRDEARRRVAQATQAIPADCRAVYLYSEVHPVHTALVAMWAGIERGVAVVNGHSGSVPPGYPAWNLAPAERRSLIDRWVLDHGGDPAAVCHVDARLRVRVASAQVPDVMVAGRPTEVALTLQNLGASTWSAAREVRLGASTADPWGIGRVEMPHDVPPDAMVTLRFVVVPPAEPGLRPFTWGLVEEAVEWVTEDLQLPPVTVLPADALAAGGEDRPVLLSSDVPPRMRAGERRRVTVVLRNDGDRSWRRDHLVRLGSREPDNDLTWGIGRVELPHDVAPGDTVALTFEVTAPRRPGTYAFSWSVLREGVLWVPPVFRLGPVRVEP